jgi:TubC N-terminal docking domain
MTGRELVTALQALGVTLWLDQDKVRYRAPAGVMTPGQLQDLRNHKVEVLAILREDQPHEFDPPEEEIYTDPRITLDGHQVRRVRWATGKMICFDDEAGATWRYGAWERAWPVTIAQRNDKPDRMPACLRDTLDGHEVRRVRWRTSDDEMVVFDDEDGRAWRYFESRGKAWPVTIPGAGQRKHGRGHAPDKQNMEVEPWTCPKCGQEVMIPRDHHAYVCREYRKRDLREILQVVNPTTEEGK